MNMLPTFMHETYSTGSFHISLFLVLLVIPQQKLINLRTTHTGRNDEYHLCVICLLYIPILVIIVPAR